MKLQIVPAKRGAQWSLGGLRAFGARPMVYMSLIGVWVLLALVVQLLPVVGTLFMWATLPLLTLGFMLTTQQVVQGRMPTLQVFVLPLQGDTARRRALWQLGALYALVMALAVAAFAVILGPDIMMPGAGAGPDAKPEPVPQAASSPASGAAAGMEPMPMDPRFARGVLWVAGTIMLLSVPFWYAPALVHWGGQSAGQALFSSVVAVWRNKGAFVVYALVNAGGVVLLGVVLSILAAVLGALGPQSVALLMVPAAFALLAIFYASLYFTYADCFGTPDSPEPTP